MKFFLDENVSVGFGRQGRGPRSPRPGGALNVRVDAYLLGWRQLISPDPGHNPDHSFYYVMRGYWDDWWMRLRNQAGAGQPIDLEALPRRGYVEVILDGYRP